MKKILVLIAAALVVIGLGACAKAETAVVLYEFTPGDYFVTNVKGSGHLLKLTPILVINSETVNADIATKTAQVRDTIITVLRDKDSAYLDAEDAQTKLKQDIIDALNAGLGYNPPSIVDVYFNDFVVQ